VAFVKDILFAGFLNLAEDGEESLVGHFVAVGVIVHG
jgi:hypothetical protein